MMQRYARIANRTLYGLRIARPFLRFSRFIVGDSLLDKDGKNTSLQTERGNYVFSLKPFVSGYPVS